MTPIAVSKPEGNNESTTNKTPKESYNTHTSSGNQNGISLSLIDIEKNTKKTVYDPQADEVPFSEDSPDRRPSLSSVAEVENNSVESDRKKKSVFKSLGFLDRFLYVWIFVAMAVGMIIGNFVPNVSHALEKGKFVNVSVPSAVGLIIMIYPILCNIEYEVLHHAFAEKNIWRQIGFSLFINWIFGPFFMMGLAWAFLPDKTDLREGLILVGLARCIAMVLIWNGLAGGDSRYCAILVSVNSILQMGLYAPYAILLIKVISGSGNDFIFSYAGIAKSVGAFLGIPLAAGLVTRFGLRRIVGARWYDNVLMAWMGTLSLVGLLFTILILFASQGKRVVDQIVSVVRVAAPMFCYFNIVFFSTLVIAWKLNFGYKMAVTQSFTASSNNFELAIAIAVATFGHDSNQALAATVGPLMEVPCLLGLVYVVRYIGKKANWHD